MSFTTTYITPDIKLSCYQGKPFKTEALFEHHLLVWLISGETKLILADTHYLFKPGDIFLIPRNQLATVINYTVNGLPHKAVAMHLTPERLTTFYAGLNVQPLHQNSDAIRRYNNHPLLRSCLASLEPYFEMERNFPGEIASLKINEAISILRVVDPGIDSLLTSFAEPGKIDLAAFMEKNFMFNMLLAKFGYLTGRSLSTFSRDFKKIYNTTPQKWLTQKRLALAHYQLCELKKRPADIYLEVGFEDLTHFSAAFKKQYGASPSLLLSGHAPQ
ncbi:MAG TPA: AraC family transcriptional regulator [Chitinophagaceae bacterium]|nr:AraC family transcriptional regulator [Chitinophagaceae bacterium]